MTRRGRRRLLILIAVIVAGGIGVVALKTVRSRNLERIADSTRAEALELYRADKWDEALPVLSRAVGSFPNDPEILLAFAETRRRNPEPRGRHLAEAFVYYQRVANVGEVQVGDGEGGTQRAADAVIASPAQLEEARIGLVELGPSLGRWGELADAAQDLLEATPPPSEDRRRQLVGALFQASLQQPEQAILSRYVTQESGALSAARARATEIADSVDADIATGGSRRTLNRSAEGNLRSLILAVAVEELDPHAVEARLGILEVLTRMGGEPDDLLPLVRRWNADWRAQAGDAADARYASIESRLLLTANRIGPAAVLLAGVDDSRPVTDRRALEELVGAFDRMATIALQRASDRVFRAEIAAAAEGPGQLSRLLLERAETLIEHTREALGTTEAWPYELALQWRFRLTREDEAADVLAEATEAGLTAQSPVLTRWAAVLPLVAGDDATAAGAVVRLRRMGRDLEDPRARDLTDAWGQALDRFLRYSPGVAPGVLATLNTYGLNAAAEAEADRIAAAEAERARRLDGGVGASDTQLAEGAGADPDADASDDQPDDDAPAASSAGPVFDAIEAVLRAAQAPSLGQRTSADVPVALYLAARHTLAVGDTARAVARFRAARRLWPAWPRAAAESINALVQNGQAARAAEELLADTAWWQRGGFFPAQQIAEAMVSLGPNGSDLTLTLPGFNQPVGRVEMVERAFNVRGTFAEDGATGSWSPQGVRLLIQALSLDEGPEAVEAMAAEADAATDIEIPVSSLLTLAGAVGTRDAGLARSLVQRALDADPEPDQTVLLRTELAELDGDRALAASLLAEAATTTTGRVSGEFALRAALYRLVDGEEGAVAEARQALSALEDPVRLSALLDGGLLWRDSSVARAAIDRLTELTGPWSTPVRLAEARYALEGPAPDGTTIDQRRGEAFRQIEAALRDAPGDPRIMAAKADLLINGFGRDNRDSRIEGIRQLDQAFNADQSNSRLALQLLPLLHEQQSWDRAGRVLDRVRSLRGSDPQLAVTLSDLYVQQGRIREAVDYLASFEDPPAAVQLRLIGLSTRIGDEAAANGLRSVLAARTDLTVDENTSLAVSRLNATADRSDAAVAEQRAWLDDRLAEADPARRSLAIAGFLAAAGRPDDARAEAEAALAADPSLGDALAIVISVIVDRDGPAAAAASLQQYLAGVSPTESLVAVLPAVLTAKGLEAYSADVQERFGRFVAETSLPARFAELRQQLSDVRRRREASPDGNVLADPQVVVRARSIVREAPRVLTGHLLLVEALLATGNTAGAVDAGLTAMEAFPGNVTAAEQTAVIAAGSGRSTDAVFAAREWFSRTDGSSVPAMNLLVGLLLDADRPAAAIEEAESFMVSAWRAAAEQPAESRDGTAARQLIFRWIVSLAEAGDRRLVRAADRAIAEDLLPVLSVADAASRTTDRAVADRYVSRAREALSAEGDAAVPGRRLGQALLEQAMATRHADPVAAGRALEMATPVMTDGALGIDARVVMAQAHATRGERSTAIELYREALALAPQAFVIKNNLAFLLAVEGSNCDEAVRLAEEALAPIDAPQVRSAILSTLALSLTCTGQFDAAVERAQEAVALNRDAPDLLATLAYVQFRAGDDVGASANAASARRQIAAARFPGQYADAVTLLDRIDAGG